MNNLNNINLSFVIAGSDGAMRVLDNLQPELASAIGEVVKRMLSPEKPEERPGEIYQGERLDGFYHGKGRLTITNVCDYEGTFKKGVFDGKGKITVCNGSVYEGEFKNGMVTGYGKKSHADGSIYEGNFIKGNLEGEGSLTLPDGSVYRGNFVNGKADGIGTLARNGKSISVLFKEGDYLGEMRRPTPQRKAATRKEPQKAAYKFEAEEKNVCKLYEEKNWESFWNDLKKIAQKDWRENLWEKALLAALVQQDLKLVEEYYGKFPKGFKSNPACSLALAFIFCQKKDYKNASQNLKKVASEYGSWELFKKLENECSLKPSAAAVAMPPEGALLSSLKADEPASNNNAYTESSIRPLSLQERAGLAQAGQGKVKTRGITVLKPEETPANTKTSPTNSDSDDEKVIPVRDVKEVSAILNDLTKRLPIFFKCARSGAHRTLVYTVNGKEFPIALFEVHGNQDIYARGTGRTIRKSLLDLEKAGEAYLKTQKSD